MTRLAQVAAVVGGLIFGVLGAAALVQAGATNLDRHVNVLGFHHTGLLGWIELVYGVILLASGFSWGVRSSAAFLGILAAGFGAVILITGQALHDSLGVHQENGLLFLVVGAIVGALAFFAGRSPDAEPFEPTV
jgi:hypothetical protein